MYRLSHKNNNGNALLINGITGNTLVSLTERILNLNKKELLTAIIIVPDVIKSPSLKKIQYMHTLVKRKNVYKIQPVNGSN